VEQLGAGSGAEGVEALLRSLLKLIRTHVNRRLTASPDSARPRAGMPVGAVIHSAVESDADAEAISTERVS
jgi:hypothetical protein